MASPIPSSTLNFADNQLGVTSGGGVRETIIIGACSSGVAGSFVPLSPQGNGLIPSLLGKGPGPDSATHALLASGQSTKVYVPTCSVAGTSSAVVNAGGGPTVTLSGAANDSTECVARITLAGVIGTSQFQYTLDGGDTWSAIYATAATFLLPNNVTLNMAAGTYVLGATYTFTTTAPMMNMTDLGNALDAIVASPYDPYFVQVVGQTADAATCLTMATLIQTKLVAAQAAQKMFLATMEAPAVDKATLISTFPAFVCEDLVIFAGFAEITNARSGLVEKRSVGRVLAPRLQRNPRNVDISRDIADTKLDPIAGVVKLVPDGAAAATGYHDEGKTPGLNAARFTCLYSRVNLQGFYAVNGNTFAAANSDYERVCRRFIVKEAGRQWLAYSYQELGRVLKIDPATKFIDGRVADAMEQKGAEAIKAVLRNEIPFCNVVLNRADDLNASPIVQATIRIGSNAYLSVYSANLGFAKVDPNAA